MHLDRKPLGYLGSVLVGMAFAAGWTPCIGPILGGILGLAATQGDVAHGTLLLAAYSAGLAVPFLAAAWAMEGVPRLVPALPEIPAVGHADQRAAA